MQVLNCRSSSPPHPSSLSSLDNGLLQNILNISPRLSSHSNPTVQLDRTSPYQTSLCLDFEKAAGCQSIVSIPSSGTMTPKSSAELRKEIARLEAQIIYLERHLLSLYRTAFEEHLPAPSNVSGTYLQLKAGSPTQILADQSYSKLEPQIQKDGFSHHNHSSPAHDLSISDNQYSTASFKAVSIKNQKFAGSGHRSLADHLGVSCMDNNLNTPGRLSEDIVRCISSIYGKLANASHNHAGFSASPTSSLSSSSLFSSKNPCDSWSPHCYEDTTMRHKGLKEEGGPHAAMVEVLKIYLDNDSFNYAAVMLQNFRSLVRSLEKVNPRKMKREEKLAFWINIHNALVMHAYLAYGTRNRVNSTSVLKAAYNVGGHCVDAYIIQSSILGIRPHHSAPWLQTLFSPGRKFKTGSSIKHVYALDYPEPLVHFALCSGAYSDPACTLQRFHDLKLAKQDFIQASIYIEKESKIFLPKIVYYFAKDMSLDLSELLELITGCVSEVQRNAIRICMKIRHDKYINWLPQSSTFRYVIHGELVEGR